VNASDVILPPCGQAALDFAARGFHAFPVPPGTKKSHKKAEHSGGRPWGATTDAEELRRDWRRWPEANVGLATGARSGFFVVEADTAAGHGVDGIANLAALIDAHGGEWPETVEALSPSGSWHVWFRWPDGGGIPTNAGRLAPGVDLRGEGGMVLAPPSAKPGAAEPYRWKNPPGRFPLADCPPWLLALARATGRKGGAEPSGHAGPRIGVADVWARAALATEVGHVFAAPAGCRNATLNRAASALGQIVAGGGLEEEDTRDLGARSWDRDARHVASWGAWLIWDSTRWRRDDCLDHMGRARAYLRARAAEVTDWAARKAEDHEAAGDGKAAQKVAGWAKGEARALRHAATVAAVVGLARSNPASAARPDDFDADPLLLGTPGGVVDHLPRAPRPDRHCPIARFRASSTSCARRSPPLAQPTILRETASRTTARQRTPVQVAM
jgi:hypothetical protein